jgi:hypothetical protein
MHSFYKMQTSFAKKCFQAGARTILVGMVLGTSLTQNVNAHGSQIDASDRTQAESMSYQRYSSLQNIGNDFIRLSGGLESLTYSATDLLKNMSGIDKITDEVSKAGKWCYHNPLKATLLTAVAVTGVAGISYMAGTTLIGTSLLSSMAPHANYASYIGFKLLQRTCVTYLTKTVNHIFWKNSDEPIFSKKTTPSSAFQSALSKTVLTEVFHIPKDIITDLKYYQSLLGASKKAVQSRSIYPLVRFQGYGTSKSFFKRAFNTTAKLAIGLFMPVPSFIK